jgi:hypothetical protein
MSETPLTIPERFQPAYRTSGLKAPVIHAGMKSRSLFGPWLGQVGRVIPGEKGIDSAAYQFCYGSSLLFGTEPQPL